jgi:hypothetical protein
MLQVGATGIKQPTNFQSVVASNIIRNIISSFSKKLYSSGF